MMGEKELYRVFSITYTNTINEGGGGKVAVIAGVVAIVVIAVVVVVAAVSAIVAGVKDSLKDE